MQVKVGSHDFCAVGRTLVLKERTRTQEPGSPKKESDLVVLIFSVPGPFRMQFQDPEYIHFMQVNLGSHNFGAVGRSMVHESKIRNKFILCR